ncbi:MAG: hypothetical protein IT364_06675 [Candidatus Hydrogenedentes bacterium]|nr:hypothetical protein [Candidatus Hydrogenedentota bacterium]
MRLLIALFVTVPLCVSAQTTFDLQTAKLVIDPKGYAQLILTPEGTPWPVAQEPIVQLHTAQEPLLPESVVSQDDKLTVTFQGGYLCEFSVTPSPGFLLFELTRLQAPADLQRLELFSMVLPGDAEVIGTLNGGRTAARVVTLSAAEINVRAFTRTQGRQDSDRAGCSHELVPSSDAKEGMTSARFTATCNAEAPGWSYGGSQLPQPIDLTGCKAIRAWIHGDGKGEALKIQLADGLGGFRDTYFPITFEGWQQVTIADSPYNTLKPGHVAGVSLYYNGLPANETVTCLVDGIEAIVVRDGREVAVPLEGFENPGSGYWAGASRSLHVETTAEHGIEPARFGLLCCAPDALGDTIERFELASGLPSPHPGGVWNKRSPWVDHSYLFITGFSEAQYEPVLAMAKRGGFDMILILQDSWTSSTGKYEVNAKAFPGGLDALAATVNRFKQEGFKVGLHFLGASIYPNDPYLTPVPDPRLVKDASAVLASDIDASAREIPITAAPDAFPAEDGGYMGSGTVVQIGDELIAYGERAMEAPFGFLGCQRGAFGTAAAPHAQGEPVRHLMRSYGYFLHDMDTTLTEEVSTNFARIANACDIDMIYFDGSERLQGDHWYYNAKLHKTFFDKLNRKDVLVQASSFSHYSWHILGRTASADGHGDIKGYLDERAGVFDAYERDSMPLDIGWYYGYDPNAAVDMFEYVLGKTIAYDSSMSFQVSYDAASRHPFTGEILDLIRRYEELRLSGRVPEEMRALLRVDPALVGRKPGEEQAGLLDYRREYRLLDDGGGQVFQRVIYTPWHDVSPADEQTFAWTIRVPEGGAKVGVQIHVPVGPAVLPGAAYGAADAMTLETFDDVAVYASKSTLEGVTQEFVSSGEDARKGGHCAVYTAESGRATNDGWSCIGRGFDAPVDISWHRGIGFWLRGDGNGGQFKLQLMDGSKAADFYIPNNFTGWRYQQISRPETDAIDYSQVRALNFYYNGLPAKSKVTCAIDDVKALRALDGHTLSDPYIEIEGQRFACGRSLVEGQYAFLYPGEPWRFYGPRWVEPESGEEAAMLELAEGEYSARIGWAGPLVAPVRARIVLQPGERHAISR